MEWGVVGLVLGPFADRSSCYRSCGGLAVAQGTRRDNALDVPRKRYARGEISKEEFERIEKYVE